MFDTFANTLFVLGLTGVILWMGTMANLFGYKSKKAKEGHLEAARELLRDAIGTQERGQKETLYTQAVINIRQAGYVLWREWPEDIRELAGRLFGRGDDKTDPES
jgi:hypothetical protein